eukprot:CFRG4851T1
MASEVPATTFTWLVNIWACIVAIAIFIIGIIEAVSIDVNCIIVGALFIIFGFCMIVLEAPYIWKVSGLTEKINRLFQQLWMKAALYAAFPFLGFICFGVTTLVGMILIWTVAALYISMYLAYRRASRMNAMENAIRLQGIDQTALNSEFRRV